jgi:hypothetical protein
MRRASILTKIFTAAPAQVSLDSSYMTPALLPSGKLIQHCPLKGAMSSEIGKIEISCIKVSSLPFG